MNRHVLEHMLLWLLVLSLFTIRSGREHLQGLNLLDARKELVLKSFGQLGDLDMIVAFLATTSALATSIAAIMK